MNGFGFEFQYQRRHLRAWLYVTASIAVMLFFTMEAIGMLSNFAGSHRILLLFSIITSLFEDAVLILPAISYIVLLQSLQWRYIIINSILRFDFDSFQRDWKAYIFF